MSKVDFKEFVKKNSYLIDQVTSGKTTWQKLYEIFDLYGEDSIVWKKYQFSETINKTSTNNVSPINNSLKELLGVVKGIDLNTVQKGLSSLDKAIEAFKGIVPNQTQSLRDTYEPRPTYKYFED